MRRAFLFELLLNGGESLFEVGNQVVDMFDTDRQTYRVLGHTSLGQFLSGQLTVCGRGWVAD